MRPAVASGEENWASARTMAARRGARATPTSGLPGWVVGLSIFASLVAALVVVPALVLVLRPRFLEPRKGEPSPPKEVPVLEETREAEVVS